MKLEEIIKTTCPRDCYDGCGIAVHKRNGVIHRVVGDRDHPISRGALCGKCALAYNGVWRDPEQRLQFPMQRVGAKGEGQFERISWQQALSTIAQRFKSISQTLGPHALVHAHYTGTCSLLAGGFPMRFFNRFGATEVEPDTICNNAGHVALSYVFGDSLNGFDPKSIEQARTVMVWGANPSASGPHVQKYWLQAADAQVVVIDPVRTETAALADLHLQPKPGTDALLAFALLRCLLDDEAIDENFVRDNTVGWQELRLAIEQTSLDDASRRTGVPCETIKAAARLYARGPALLWIGQGLQRQALGGNVVRACAMLPVVTGNIGKLGGGVCYVNGAGPRQIDDDYVSAPHLRRQPTDTVSHMNLVERLNSTRDTQAFVCWNINVAASGPRQNDLRDALSREDLFTVVIDLFQTDTADFADIILPAASFLEFDDLVLPYFYYYISAQSACESPPGEALPNQEIFRRLARAMNYTDEELFETDASILDFILKRSACAMSFDELRNLGSVDPFAEPYVPFQSLVFSTPSGKIEIASAQAQSDSLPRLPEPTIDEPKPAGWFRLLSPASEWLMNNSYGNDSTVQRTIGECRATLNVEDARLLKVDEGSRLELYNEQGVLPVIAAISDVTQPGVILTAKGRWPKFEPSGANVNVLNNASASDMGASTAVHGTHVQLRVISD